MTVWTVAIAVVLGLVVFLLLPELLTVGIGAAVVVAVIVVMAVVFAILGWIVGLLPEVIVAIAWSYGIMLIWVIAAVFAVKRLVWMVKTQPRLRDVDGAPLYLSTVGGLVAGGMAAVPLEGNLDPNVEPFILIAMATPIVRRPSSFRSGLVAIVATVSDSSRLVRTVRTYAVDTLGG